MQNYLKPLYSILAAAIVIMSAPGCVKDKGFEDHVYGITDPANQPKGVLFQSSRLNSNGDPVATIIGISSGDTVQTLQTVVKIAANEAVSSDLKVKITLNSSIVDPTGLTVLDPQYYEIVNPEVTIPAGEKFAYFQIKIPNASIIDPSVVYGIGFTITEVGSGYTIAENSKNLVLGIAIKNQYDGTYHSTGYVYHPSAPRPVDEIKVLSTVSATSVSCGFGDLGSAGYVALFTVDPATNKVSISDYSTGIPIVGFDDGLPSTNPGYTPQWSGSSQCNNTYDPATQTFYIRMGYMGSTGWRVSEEIIVHQ